MNFSQTTLLGVVGTLSLILFGFSCSSTNRSPDSLKSGEDFHLVMHDDCRMLVQVEDGRSEKEYDQLSNKVRSLGYKPEFVTSKDFSKREEQYDFTVKHLEKSGSNQCLAQGRIGGMRADRAIASDSCILSYPKCRVIHVMDR
jgi:hypothetical protein